MTTSLCASSTFNSLHIPDAAVLSITANPVLNYTATSPLFSNGNHGYIPPTQVSFCNITVSHSHHGHNESITTRIYLPIGTWNSRLQGIGGGGFIAGLAPSMLVGFDGAIAEGYAAIGTNAGIYTSDVFGEDAAPWALLEKGKVNMHKLEDFAYRALGDMVHVSKEVVKMFYGEYPTFSYFSGCSGGGRQGYMFAERYPEAWDGIAACAPGIYWDQLPEQYWAQILMNIEGAYPRQCELMFLRNAAMNACDELDGVTDGVLQDPDACTFDPMALRGVDISCPETGGSVKLSDIAIRIAKITWEDGKLENVHSQMHMGGYDVNLIYLANSLCTNLTCIGDPNPLAVNWMKMFVAKDAEWNPRSIKSLEEFESIRAQSAREYESLIGVSIYNLSEFRDAGGKMITYHGMSDYAVSYKNTQKYYDAVTNLDHTVHDYYRLFLAPGLEHVAGGRGAYPHTTFHALVDWVERGVVPDSLDAVSAPSEAGNVISRKLCAYPAKSKYVGTGDTNDLGGWTCVSEGFRECFRGAPQVYRGAIAC